MSTRIYSGQSVSLPVTFKSNPLVHTGLDYADIVDVYMGLKQEVSDGNQAHAAHFQFDGAGGGAATGNVTYDETTHTFVLTLTEDDEPEPGKYFIIVGVLFNGRNHYQVINYDKCCEPSNEIHIEPNPMGRPAITPIDP